MADAARDVLLRLDRRRFLALAAGSAAWGTGALGCGGVPAGLLPDPALRLEVLSARAYATFNAAAAALVGAGAAEAIWDGRLDPAHEADAWIAREPGLGGALGTALWVLEWGVHPLIAKWKPFTALDASARTHCLDDLMRSRIDLKRDLFKGVRSLAFIGFYTSEASHALTGYPGPFGGADGAGIALAMTYPEDP